MVATDTMGYGRRQSWLLLLGMCACLVLTRLVWSKGNLPWLMGLALCATLAGLLLLRRPLALAPRRMLLLFCVVGLGTRLLFFDVQPQLLSDDVYRYLWDGRVQAAGINPYRHAPRDPALKELRDNTVYPLINHKQYRTIYPPAAQVLFLLAHKLGGNRLLALRLLYLLFDTLAVLLLFSLLRTPSLLLTYLLSPLLILESYGALHLDLTGGVLLLVAFLLFRRHGLYASLFPLALAIALKYIALVVVPVFLVDHWRRAGPGIRRSSATLGLVPPLLLLGGLLFLLWLPYVDAGKHLFSQLAIYGRYWQFNGPVHTLFSFLPQAWPRLASTLLMLAGLVWFWFHPRLESERRLTGALAVALLCSPTLYPWYLLWLLPLLCLAPQRGLLLLCGTVFLSYVVRINYLHQGLWQEQAWVLAAEYLPPLALTIHDQRKKQHV